MVSKTLGWNAIPMMSFQKGNFGNEMGMIIPEIKVKEFEEKSLSISVRQTN
jgi:hypothetical protein